MRVMSLRRFFYKEQQHRMEVLSQEVVTFGDMFCQMHDLVRSFLLPLPLHSRRACVCVRSTDAWHTR
jgi:hypothetical protein